MELFFKLVVRVVEPCSRQVKKLFGDSFNFDLDLSGKLDTQIYTELTKLNSHLDLRNNHDKFRETYLKILEFELTWDNKASLMPGVLKFLRFFVVTIKPPWGCLLEIISLPPR